MVEAGGGSGRWNVVAERVVVVAVTIAADGGSGSGMWKRVVEVGTVAVRGKPAPGMEGTTVGDSIINIVQCPTSPSSLPPITSQHAN